MKIFIFISVILSIQVYFYFSSKTLFINHRDSYKTLYNYLYIFYNLFFFLILIFFPKHSSFVRHYIVPFFFLGFVLQVISCVFFLVEDARYLSEFLFKKTKQIIIKDDADIQMSRYQFIKWTGIAFGGSLVLAFVYGFSNKYNYQIHRLKLKFKKLPQKFNGLRIVQISDIHSGSFDNAKAVEKGIQKIISLKPDIIFFTGDLVNNIQSEIIPYKAMFSQLQAPLGVYSILGNHDYGDYVVWESPQAKQKNLDQLIQHHKELGWNLLLNANYTLHKEGQEINIIGVENWSSKNFVTHGDLKKASSNLNADTFNILLSHDPSHWDAEVLELYPQIDLTLSGHTHGMQFGVELGNWRWSPVKYIYSQWAGLYEKQTQKLYVNRGFGFLGYHGRVGILPEITLIVLQSANAN